MADWSAFLWARRRGAMWAVCLAGDWGSRSAVQWAHSTGGTLAASKADEKAVWRDAPMAGQWGRQVK